MKLSALTLPLLLLALASGFAHATQDHQLLSQQLQLLSSIKSRLAQAGYSHLLGPQIPAPERLGGDRRSLLATQFSAPQCTWDADDNSCYLNPLYAGSTNLPAPSTPEEKLFAAIGYGSYECSQKAESACNTDTKCIWTPPASGSQGYCSISELAFAGDLFKLFFCEDSLLYKLFVCALEGWDNQASCTQSGPCKWEVPQGLSMGFCFHKDFANFTAYTNQMSQFDDSSLPKSVFGSCPAADRAYALYTSCTYDASTACSADSKCKWVVYDESDPSDGNCELQAEASIAIMFGGNGAFTQAITAAAKKCDEQTSQSTCIGVATVTINSAKLEPYKNLKSYNQAAASGNANSPPPASGSAASTSMGLFTLGLGLVASLLLSGMLH